ncbi:MAG: hypothetical protein JWO61_108 [Candidatus Saccharibacteria bacterium]|nr:hypothetical protein [Candidatus Saccharibacteria bacterium]
MGEQLSIPEVDVVVEQAREQARLEHEIRMGQGVLDIALV